MNRDTVKGMLALLRSAICNSTLDAEEKQLMKEGDIEQLYLLSKKHDLAHLVCQGLYNNSLIDKTNSFYTKFHQKQIMAIYRYEQMNYEFGKLCQALEKAEITFIPLKGTVIRSYYAKPWYRTSCDIDLLVKEQELEKALDYLTGVCSYTKKNTGPHDVSLYTPNGIHIELHYRLVDEGQEDSASTVLKGVWEDARLCEGYNYRYGMSDEMFYFYHIYHMAKHIENGGCGIRPFIDLNILDGIKEASFAKRDELLKKGDLLKFAEAARKLSRVWLEGEEADELCEKLQYYIISGGVYGNDENRIAVQQQKKGGKLAYAFSKIFLSYDELKFYYPVLMRHPWLMPLMQIIRWFGIVFAGRTKRSLDELKQSSDITRSASDETKQFMQELGL